MAAATYLYQVRTWNFTLLFALLHPFSVDLRSRSAPIMDIDQLINELPEDDSVSTVLPCSPDEEILHTGPCCEKCGASFSANGAFVCQQCGWYASIGSFVEIDRSWEVATNPELATEAAANAEAGPAAISELPQWAWILSGCIVGVIVESVAARLLTPEGGQIRTIWSLSQLFLGAFAFAICHTLCFLRVMKDEADTKMLDCIMRPINAWSHVFRGMPKRSWMCYVGLSGLTAVVMSVLVIGAIPYGRLLDWGIEAPANNSLEDAIGDFAGAAGGKKKKDADKKRQKEDCVIIGYMTNQAGEVQTLLLAATHNSKLSYAGSVRLSNLSKEERSKLVATLKASKTRRASVRASIDGATWVKPKHLCRISYKRRGEQGGLYGTRLESLLGKVNLGK